MALQEAVSATAVEAWDKRWGTDGGRADWVEAHPDVTALLPELQARDVRRVLDLGCGVGRHALFLAQHGFAVEALDGSPTGLAVLGDSAKARGLRLGLHEGSADTLPFDGSSFDFVLSWNVIYHGTMADVGRRLAEVWRVLKPGGLFQGTLLTTRNANYGIGRQISPGTFVIDGMEEKGHPHFYCDAPGLLALFAGFELLALSQHQHRQPGSWHWHIIAERRA